MPARLRFDTSSSRSESGSSESGKGSRSNAPQASRKSVHLDPALATASGQGTKCAAASGHESPGSGSGSGFYSCTETGPADDASASASGLGQANDASASASGLVFFGKPCFDTEVTGHMCFLRRGGHGEDGAMCSMHARVGRVARHEGQPRSQPEARQSGAQR